MDLQQQRRLIRYLMSQQLPPMDPNRPGKARCVTCFERIIPSRNHRRLVQVCGSPGHLTTTRRINRVLDTGACSLACLEFWWSAAPDALLIDVSRGVDPATPAAMKVWDFIACRRDTLVQIYPMRVFHSIREVNEWWQTTETRSERADRLAARARKVDFMSSEALAERIARRELMRAA